MYIKQGDFTIILYTIPRKKSRHGQGGMKKKEEILNNRNKLLRILILFFLYFRDRIDDVDIRWYMIGGKREYG